MSSHELQHTRLPCPSLSSRVCSNSCPLSQWCHPTISSFVTPFSSSSQSFTHQGLFQWVYSLHQVAKVLEFSFSTSPSNEYSGLISFRFGRFDLLAVQGTLKSLLQHYRLKASVLWCSVFIVQLSHSFMTTGKTIALSIRTFVQKVMSLLFNTLSRFVTATLPKRKCLLIRGCSDFGAQENEIWYSFHISPIYLPWSWNQTPWSSFSNIAF